MELEGLLRGVNRPARYTGGEWNSVKKDWDSVAVRVALSYPDTYEIGMSNVALPILYDLLNSEPDVLAERVFTPWTDMDGALRQAGLPLFSLESRRPLRDFDIIGFSLGYELTYTNVLQMLDLAGIPVLAAERGDEYPLIIAGGSAALNPEPMTDFIDVFVIGDGEEVTLELLTVFRRWKTQGAGARKRGLLLELAKIPGIYVPSLYQVDYLEDGRVKSITPAATEASPSIRRRTVAELPPPVTRLVVPYLEVIHDRGAIEVQRGCSAGCRFCQAGTIYRPVRERPHDEVVAAAGEIITNCGYDAVSLVSLNTSDYGGIETLVERLSRQYPRLAVSLPSLRIDASAVKLVASLPTRSRTGLTFAPEAGTDRLRRSINKRLTDADILNTAGAAFSAGWTGLKLYFMVGLPGETTEDIEGICTLVKEISQTGRRSAGRTPQLRVSVATFVPKPHTPFQWVAQEAQASISTKQDTIRQGISAKSIKLSWSDPRLSLLEAALSRGDRRMGRVIYNAWRGGAVFDAWQERFRFDTWLGAFTQAGLEPGFYAHRERTEDEVLPWSHIDTGVSNGFLQDEYRRALACQETGDCRYDGCNICGLEDSQPACAARLKV